MAAGLVVCFTWLGGFFDLHTADLKALLVMGTLMIMSYSVFSAITRVFDLGDRLVDKVRRWKEKRHADI